MVDIGDGWAVTFKVESHNHPSYVEPYQGAATGVGGIVRDIMAMGARPIAVMDPLRFGAIDHPDTPRVRARHRRRRRRLRQLPRPAQHRRRGRLRPLLPGQPAGQRAVRRHAAARGPPPGQRHRRGQPGRPVRRPHRRRRHRRRRRCWPRETFDDDRPGQAPGRAGRRPVRREGADRVLPRPVRGRRGRGHPGPRRRRAVLRDVSELASNGDGGMHVRLDRVPLRDPIAAARRDPDERVAGADDGRRHARRPRRRSWPSPTGGTSRPP